MQAHVPLLVGGGSRRVLGLAARVADTVGFTGLGRTLADGQHHEPTGFPPGAVDDQVTLVRDAAGSRWADLELQALVQAVVATDDTARATASLRLRLPSLARLGDEELIACPYLLVGTTEAMVEHLLARRERWGFSHVTFRADALDVMAPVVALLAGT